MQFKHNHRPIQQRSVLFTKGNILGHFLGYTDFDILVRCASMLLCHRVQRAALRTFFFSGEISGVYS
jgi:hypothetical protein